ncbi:hypothetical protein ALI144C_15340 [Actinosynnema sp. ALI-1.44]|uniref:hypothetical protein n=1 Tax=Actinosynnema sp. ALI-1.44 TaxID=1933779 RepID=UPI00097BEBA8|nr:hypothetical protein [Actinosynnema sp. ALI-1.44]ONI84266.1 hypothetical protein ALI144C_15340 [Actinosynnema sp. ALI-1.44]
MSSEHDAPVPREDVSEELDEDRLQADPLEAGMDPPERWSGVDKYGMTPYEQSHPRPFGERLEEEEDQAESVSDLPPLDEEIAQEAADRGQSADQAGGSMAAEERTPEPPD